MSQHKNVIHIYISTQTCGNKIGSKAIANELTSVYQAPKIHNKNFTNKHSFYQFDFLHIL